MRNLFVHELFVLLHQLGITQQEVAEYLHVARASVAGWAGGQRPIPKRHAQAFLSFARSAIDTACATAWAENREDERTLLSQGTAKRFETRVKEQLRRWELEIYATTGRLDEEYERHAHTLLSYLHLPPSKLSREERETVRLAGNGMLRALRALAHLYNRPEETEGRVLGPPFELSPLAHFDTLVAWWSALQQEDESEESGP
jgi:transcriptional regulator with XRE-family HTH domain